MTQPIQPGYGQFTGYTPIAGAPGAYEFDLATGGKRKFAGQAAENLRQQIDASGGKAVGSEMYPQGQGPIAAPVGPGGGPAQAPTPQPTPMFSTKGGGVAMLRPGGNPQNPADWFERMPARAASKGGMMAQGMTSQGGYEVDEQYLQQKEASDLRVQAIHEQAFERGKEVAAERSGMLAAQQQQAERDLANQAKENAAKEKRLGEYQAKLDKAEADYTGFSKEKEREANSPQGKLTTFVNTLSSALGALGAGLARTPNFAAEAVQRHNEMQLRREEAELRVRKDSRDNLLGQLQREMGSLDLAKSAYRAIQAKQGALAYEALAQKEKDVDRQKFDMLVAEMLHQQALGHRESYLRNSAGEVTRTFRYNPGSAGSAGGDRPIALDALSGIANVGQTYAGTNKTNADASSAARGDAPKPVPPERTTQIAEDANILSLGNKILNNEVVQGKSDLFEASGSIRSKVPLIGPALAPENFKEYEQDLQKWQNLRIKAITGAGLSEQEAVRIAKGEVGENKAKNRIKQGVGSGMNEAAARLKANFATLPPEQQQEIFRTLPPDVRQMLQRQGGQ